MRSREYRTDEKLLQLMEKGNQMAFSEFFDRYWEHLLDVALKILKDSKYAEDCVQEVFIDFWNKRSSSPIINLSGYLHQATKYKCLDHIRKRKIPPEQLDHTSLIYEVNMPDHLIEYKEMHQLVEESIKELPKQCKRVFRMSRFDQMSNREIAEQLDLSVRTVESHIAHALRLIRLKLGKEVVLLILVFPQC